MKRFWKEIAVVEHDDGWQIALDGRALKTQGGAHQVLPSAALAELLAQEWRTCGEEIDPRGFPLRDLADFAIDKIGPSRSAAITILVAFADTDTLCYRADPDEPLYRHQLALWEPVLIECESRHGVRFERISGITHRSHPPETLSALENRLEGEHPFTLAALTTMASLAASLVVALAALEPGADIEALFAASNAEEDWQAELWGWEPEAAQTRATRLEAFVSAAEFAKAF